MVRIRALVNDGSAALELTTSVTDCRPQARTPNSAMGSNCSSCRDEGVLEEATCFCRTCKRRFCDRCVKEHNKFLKFHDILGQDRKDDWAKPNSRLKTTRKCTTHAGNDVTIYCARHDVVCCSLCADLKHRSECQGWLSEIKDVKKTTPQDLCMLLRQIDHTIDDFVKVEKQLREEKRLPKAKLESVKMIKDLEEKLTRIKEMERQTLQKIEKSVETNIESCLTHARDLNEIRRQIEKLIFLDEEVMFIDTKNSHRRLADHQNYLFTLARKAELDAEYRVDENIRRASEYIEKAVSVGSQQRKESTRVPAQDRQICSDKWPGTTEKFVPPMTVENGASFLETSEIQTRHQVITAMPHYEMKSLEELRFEDYQAGRTGQMALYDGAQSTDDSGEKTGADTYTNRFLPDLAWTATNIPMNMRVDSERPEPATVQWGRALANVTAKSIQRPALSPKTSLSATNSTSKTDKSTTSTPAVTSSLSLSGKKETQADGKTPSGSNKDGATQEAPSSSGLSLETKSTKTEPTVTSLSFFSTSSSGITSISQTAVPLPQTGVSFVNVNADMDDQPKTTHDIVLSSTTCGSAVTCPTSTLRASSADTNGSLYTGAQNGECRLQTLFCEKAKLFCIDTESGEWKERGVGRLNVYMDKTDRRFIIMMNREHTFELCTHHDITKDMKLIQNIFSETSWIWSCIDFSVTKKKLKAEKLAVQFKTRYIAEKFKNTIETCQADMTKDEKTDCQSEKEETKEADQAKKTEKSAEKTGSSEKKSEPAASGTGKLSSMFKPKECSWTCGCCYVRNNGDILQCPCCNSLKPGVKKYDIQAAASDKGSSESSSVTLGAGGGFTVSVPAAGSIGEKGGFTFGDKPVSTAGTTSGSGLSFGTPTTASASQTAMFKFGSSGFGLNTPETTTSTPASETSLTARSSFAGFKSGGDSFKSSGTSVTTTSTSVTSGFGFGITKPTSTPAPETSSTASFTLAGLTLGDYSSKSANKSETTTSTSVTSGFGFCISKPTSTPAPDTSSTASFTPSGFILGGDSSKSSGTSVTTTSPSVTSGFGFGTATPTSIPTPEKSSTEKSSTGSSGLAGFKVDDDSSKSSETLQNTTSASATCETDFGTATTNATLAFGINSTANSALTGFKFGEYTSKNSGKPTSSTESDFNLSEPSKLSSSFTFGGAATKPAESSTAVSSAGLSTSTTSTPVPGTSSIASTTLAGFTFADDSSKSSGISLAATSTSTTSAASMLSQIAAKHQENTTPGQTSAAVSQPPMSTPQKTVFQGFTFSSTPKITETKPDEPKQEVKTTTADDAPFSAFFFSTPTQPAKPASGQAQATASPFNTGQSASSFGSLAAGGQVAPAFGAAGGAGVGDFKGSTTSTSATSRFGFGTATTTSTPAPGTGFTASSALAGFKFGEYSTKSSGTSTSFSESGFNLPEPCKPSSGFMFGGAATKPAESSTAVSSAGFNVNKEISKYPFGEPAKTEAAKDNDVSGSLLAQYLSAPDTTVEDVSSTTVVSKGKDEVKPAFGSSTTSKFTFDQTDNPSSNSGFDVPAFNIGSTANNEEEAEAHEKVVETIRSHAAAESTPVASSTPDEVVFVKEVKATAEQIQRARELMLPDHFFLYEQKPPCPGCRGCEDGRNVKSDHLEAEEEVDDDQEDDDDDYEDVETEDDDDDDNDDDNDDDDDDNDDDDDDYDDEYENEEYEEEDKPAADDHINKMSDEVPEETHDEEDVKDEEDSGGEDEDGKTEDDDETVASTNEGAEVEEPGTKIFVTNIPSSVNDDYLALFFENKNKFGGGTVISVELNEEDGTAIVEFAESEAVQTVLQKQQNKPVVLSGAEVKVERIIGPGINTIYQGI